MSYVIGGTLSQLRMREQYRSQFMTTLGNCSGICKPSLPQFRISSRTVSPRLARFPDSPLLSQPHARVRDLRPCNPRTQFTHPGGDSYVGFFFQQLGGGEKNVPGRSTLFSFHGVSSAWCLPSWAKSKAALFCRPPRGVTRGGTLNS